MFGTLGVQEMIIIFFVALVLFGPKKLPELGKTIGKAFTEFRRASNDLKSTFEREMQTLEREGESIQRAAETAPSVDQTSQNHPDPFLHWGPPEPASTLQPAAALEPTTVGVSETSDAESHQASELASIEGTVARSESPHSDPIAEHAAPVTPA